MKTYAEKLKDPRWQRKSLEIMERDNFKCRHCGTHEKTLHVHHRIYSKGKSPWEYGNHLLVSLCEDCHKIAEDHKLDISLVMGKSRSKDKYITLIAKDMDQDPVEWTFWGWAAESLARCILYKSQIEESEDEETKFINLQEMKLAVVDAVREIFRALDAEEKNYTNP